MIGGHTVRRALPLKLDGDDLAGASVGVLRLLRPADGWLALILLAANLCVVVLAVERADWAPTPSLVGILLLGMLTAFVFHRIAVYWFLAIIPGLILGGLTVIWQISGYSFDGETLGGVGALWNRFRCGWRQEEHINIDKVPFASAWSRRRGSPGTLGPGSFCGTAISGAFSCWEARAVFQPHFSTPNTPLLSLYLCRLLLWHGCRRAAPEPLGTPRHPL